MRSDEYFVDEEGTFSTGQMYGNMMHLVFSRIVSIDDVEPVLDTMQKEGLIPVRYRVDILEKVKKMISQPGVSRWFAEKENRVIYNERRILCGDGKVLRPDRVVIEDGLVGVVDFKFGKVEKESYRNQVKNYMNHLEKIGYSKVEGFVWYVMLGKTIQIQAR